MWTHLNEGPAQRQGPKLRWRGMQGFPYEQVYCW